ncbi:MAG: PAS domain S-box protein [Desulfuromonadaceae bacterium]|nr:PAS domain S-box protein [Desulfuromonadaceae bacterium]
MSRFTFKTKVTLFFPIAITAALAALLFLILSVLQTQTQKTIAAQQLQTVSILADATDRSVETLQETLSVIAGRISRSMIDDPKQALAYLQQYDEHLFDFDNGLFLFDSKGRIVAELPLGLQRVGKDFSFRDYYKQTVATRRRFISDPYVSSQDHHPPAMMFTSPIFNENGSLIAVLGGSMDLTKAPFLSWLENIRLGKNGYMFLFNTDRLMILHPDKSRIMKKDIPPGANKLLDKSIEEGFEGTGETINSRGLQTLSTFKRLKTKNWILAANYPLTEAYAPAHKIRTAFLIVLPICSFGLFWIMRRYLNRMTDPIMKLARHVEDLPLKSGSERIFISGGGDEIAVLEQAFNDLVREGDLQRSKLETDLQRYERADAQLHRQNEYLQALHETTLGLISRLDVASLLQAIVTRAGTLVGTEHCFVYLKNVSGTEMEMMFQSGIYNHLHHYPIKPGEGIAGRIWNSGKMFHIDDYARWEGRLPDPDRDVLRAMAGVPLKSGEETVGVLGVAFVDEKVFLDDEQLKLLIQFGELASLALENARLSDESKRELSERIKAEENLRKFSVAVEQSPVSIVITDTAGTIEYVNQHFTKLTGYSLEEAVGLNTRILKTGETSPDEYRQLWETILAGGEWRGEFHNLKKNGELYWEQAYISPIRDKDDRITHFIGIKEDITERKQLENQLHHSQKMEAIGQLAGGIAHDFNNILTAIIGYSSIMQLKLPDGSPLKKNAEQIVVTAERGARLTQGLLAFSRKQATNPVEVDLNEVLNRVHQLLLRLISEDINLEIIISHQGLPVLADSVQIEQVLMNLATNARDALPKGGSIVIKSEAVNIDSDFILARGFGYPGNYALLTFTDNGEGMDDEIVKHIFEPFYTTKELGKGTGLGLSIVYGIIKKHGGYITCQSKIGTGTSFHVYLPLLAGLGSDEEKNPSESGLPNQGTDVILVAEDNDIARSLAKEILEEFGYSVLEAKDGQEALEIFKDNADSIDLIILDVIMPKLNGREVYDAARAIDPLVKILFCSGYANDLVISQGGLDKGMNYLAKPFTPKELLMKIREVLDNGE